MTNHVIFASIVLFSYKRDLSYQYMLEMCNHSSFCVFEEQKLKSRTVLKGWFIQKRKFCHNLLKLFQTGFLSAIEHKLHIICTPTNFVSYAHENCVLYARQTHSYHIYAKVQFGISIPRVFVFISRTIYTHFHETGSTNC